MFEKTDKGERFDLKVLNSLSKKSRALRNLATVRAMTGSPSFSAAVPARCTNTGT